MLTVAVCVYVCGLTTEYPGVYRVFKGSEETKN